MTVVEISGTHSKATADGENVLYFADDTSSYSVIVCKTKDVSKIKEV